MEQDQANLAFSMEQEQANRISVPSTSYAQAGENFVLSNDCVF
jgi:hypothetical protein